MIQEIQPHVFDNTFHPRAPKAGDYILSYEGREIIMRENLTFFRFEDCPSITDWTYLFSVDDTGFFLGDLSSLPHTLCNMQEMRTFQPQFLAFAAVTGWQIFTWMKDNRYCGRCSSAMKQDERERAMRCPSCGNIIYPRINPAVIVAVRNSRDQLLVTKYAGRSYQRYALVAGYTEIGETIEETVIREVKEETGLDVCDLHYDKCQPWPFTSTLLFGFWCRVRGSDEIHIDETELRLARWADRSEELSAGSSASLTSDMIRRFKEGNDPF